MGKKFLRFVSILYLIGAVALIGLGIACFIPVGGKLTKNIPMDTARNVQLDKTTVAAIGFFVMAVFSLIYFGLVKRALKDGNKSTFLLILAILHLAGEILSIFRILSNGFNPEMVSAGISILIDLCILISIVKIREEANDE